MTEINLINPQAHPRLKKYRKTNLTNEQLQLLGTIAVIWSAIEYKFHRIVWLLIGRDDIGSLVTTDMGNVSTSQLCRNLAHLKLKNEAIKQYTLTVVSLVDAARARRNKIVHGLTIFSDADAPFSQTRDAKSGKGIVRTSKQDISVKSLEQLADRLALVEVAVDGAMYQNLALVLEETGQLQGTIVNQAVKHSTLIEIDQVQKLLGLLSPQTHDHSKNSPPPQSSSV